MDLLDFTVAEPAGPSAGDAYINTVTGVGSVTAQAVSATIIYTWDATDWESTVPYAGMVVFDNDSDQLYTFDGAALGICGWCSW